MKIELNNIAATENAAANWRQVAELTSV
jgi:hypothetical protein